MAKRSSLKVGFALLGIFVAALIGFLVGAVVGHPPGGSGYEILGSLIGALIAADILILGEALRPEK